MCLAAAGLLPAAPPAPVALERAVFLLVGAQQLSGVHRSEHTVQYRSLAAAATDESVGHQCPALRLYSGGRLIMSHLSIFLSGIITAGYVVAALFFAKFWRRTRDALFIAFSIAFLLLALNQLLLAVINI